MPVVSPHRSTSSGGYRSSFSSSIERPYFPSSYSPRISSYSERFTTRSYTDPDGRRIFSRSGSITEDGVTTRFREETRENSLRRDSLSRDSGISSIRESSILDYPRRDSSLTRDGSRLSTANVIDSVAELRNKYSPANYVPTCLRKNENISRSKSINDIGLPPIETKPVKKKVTDNSLNYNNSIGLISNNTNTENGVYEEDDNGNRTSVADLRKKFDEKPLKSQKSSSPPIDTPSLKVSDNIFKKQDVQEATGSKVQKNEVKAPKSEVKIQNGDVKKKTDLRKNQKSDIKNELQKNTTKRSQDCVKTGSKTSLNELTSDKPLSNGEARSSSDKDKLVNGYEGENKSKGKDGVDGVDSRQFAGDTVEQNDSAGSGDASLKISRVNNYASFYPVKSYQKGEEGLSNGDVASQCTENGEARDGVSKDLLDKDLGASPKLTRSTISPTNSSLSAATAASSSNSLINSNSLPRRSVERERQNSYGGGAVGGKEDDQQPRSNHHDRIYDRMYDRTGGGGGVGAVSQTRTLGLNGLKNIGNTCFMNSVIQCLSNTRLLLEYVKKDGYVKDINTTISGMKGALIKAFAEVIKELWSEDSCDRVVNTASLKTQIQRFAPRFMGYAQQDAQEFLRYLLEGLHEDVNRVTEKPKPILTEIDEKLSDSEKAKESWSRYLRMDNSRIVDHFVGQLKSTLRCTHCGHASVTFDPFWDLSLPIPQRTGQLRLSQCLESFTREETLDGDEKPTCSKCKERRKCTKSFTIQKFPKILVIHLKRFSPTERFRGKLNVTVDFPLEGLDMSNYAADNVAPPKYNLYAVSNHSGTTYSGHYTAYCRHPYTHTWHEYNDSRVSSISAKSIVSSEAYVLFYELDGQKSHL